MPPRFWRCVLRESYKGLQKYCAAGVLTAEAVLESTAEVLERYCRSTAEVLQMHDKVLESTLRKSSVTLSLVDQSPVAPKNLEVCTRKCYKVLEKCCRSTLQKYCRSTAEVLQRTTKVLQRTWEVSRITNKFSDLFLGKHKPPCPQEFGGVYKKVLQST